MSVESRPVESRHISEEVNKKRQQIRKGIEDYIKYIKLHIKLQEDCRDLCCGLETLDINDVDASLIECDKAIKVLIIEINVAGISPDYKKNNAMIEKKKSQKQSLQQFRIRLLDYQTSQQRYGRLGNIPDKLDESHIIDLLQKRYNRTLKTPNEPLLETVQHFISSHEEDSEKQDDIQLDYLYIWMTLNFFILIDQLKKSQLLRELNDEQILNIVSYVLKQKFTKPIQISYLEDKIYEKEKQFSDDIKPSLIQGNGPINGGVGGNREKKYYRRKSSARRRRPSRKSSATKRRRSRRPHRRTARK